jgi:hypothetical protein
MGQQWLAADAWIAATERARAADAYVPDYQRGQLPAPAPARTSRQPGTSQRPRLTDDEYRAAASRAREVGVRAAAREVGVSHAALLQGWRRRGIVVRRG